MLNEQEAHDLMIKFIDLRTQFNETGDAKIGAQLKAHEKNVLRNSDI